MMRNHKEPVLLGLLGFSLTCLMMLPPIVSDRAKKADRIAAHEALIGADAVRLGTERQARLTTLVRNIDHAAHDREPARK